MSANAILAPSRRAADPKTELFLWQRTLFFRPWYRGAKVIEIGCRDGKYLAYASAFADEAVGFESDTTYLSSASVRHSNAEYRYSDLIHEDYACDVLLGFEALEEVDEPYELLGALKGCTGTLVLSASHTPKGQAEGTDIDLTPSHTSRWTAAEFRKLIETTFPDRKVQFLSQTATWPARLEYGLKRNAVYTIAVIGERPLPTWPKLGLAMPTLNAERVRSAVLGFSRFYPGEVHFAVVANAPAAEHLEALRGLCYDLPELITLVESETNLGFGLGCNRGLDVLAKKGAFDLYGVTNDDVLPAIDCLPQMVSAFIDLQEAGQRPGVVGPVTNSIHGPQQVEIGKYTNFDEMIELSSAYHLQHHSAGTPTDRLRGLLMLIDPKCLEEVGGFDPIFGLGNWEDDDHNLRCRLAGYSLWIIDGAFLHHEGSATFKQAGLNYASTIDRNLELICEKWGVERVEDLFKIDRSTLPLNISLSAIQPASGHRVKIDNQVVDLVHQATDVEFAAFVFEAIKSRPREERLKILEAIAA